MSRPGWRAAVVGLSALLLGVSAGGARSTRFELVNLDGEGEGLNDARAFAPVGGNTATTLGAARMKVVEMAAAMWAQALSSPVRIRIGVSFDGLGGTATSAHLARGGPEEAFRDFAGAPVAGTWYASALADRLAGVDLSGGTELDLTLVVNSDVDGDTVLGVSTFYYGLDHEPGPGDVSLLSVVSHELAHGLGFTTPVSPSTGAKLLGWDDAFLLNLELRGSPPSSLALMSDVERVAAFASGTELVWNGPTLTAKASTMLTGGLSPEGQVRMYAPVGGSTSAASHFATILEPAEIMEPFYDGAAELDFCLTLSALADIGWGAPQECSTIIPIGESVLAPTTGSEK